MRLREIRSPVSPACAKMKSEPASVLDGSKCPAVERNREELSGIWVFRGTRVPVSALVTNIESGATADEFLEWFPGATRDQVNCVLEHAERSLAEPTRA